MVVKPGTRQGWVANAGKEMRGDLCLDYFTKMFEGRLNRGWEIGKGRLSDCSVHGVAERDVLMQPG